MILVTVRLRESYHAAVAHGARIDASAVSSWARGVELDGKWEAALPAALVRLGLDHDRVPTY